MEDRPLTDQEISDLRAKAEAALKELQERNEVESSDSWIKPSSPSTAVSSSEPDARSAQCRYFDRFGFLRLAQFCAADEVNGLKRQMEDLANRDWDPAAEKITSFSTDADNNQSRKDYFLDSSNRIHYFAEPGSLNDDGTSLKPEYENDKLAALNKAGHAMHIRPGAFRDYALSDKVRSLVTDLGWEDPVVPQSMYIFKQPRIGGTVHSHQDSTFLYTTPKQSCLGLWLALDDATLENGCLWVRPESHREPLRRQFIRNPEYFEQNNPEAPKLTLIGQDKSSHVTWEGSLPKDRSLWDAGFIPIECKAGDLLAFCGTLDHLSLPNFSNRQRHTFQLHLVEGPNAGVTWSPQNWLQYPDGEEFIALVR